MSVRKRITVLATLASILAVVLFAVPMAIVVARYLVADERNELQRAAATIAATVSGDLSRSVTPATPAAESGTQVIVYDNHGCREQRTPEPSPAAWPLPSLSPMETPSSARCW
jgi:hypothetical protein